MPPVLMYHNDRLCLQRVMSTVTVTTDTQTGLKTRHWSLVLGRWDYVLYPCMILAAFMLFHPHKVLLSMSRLHMLDLELDLSWQA